MLLLELACLQEGIEELLCRVVIFVGAVLPGQLDCKPFKGVSAPEVLHYLMAVAGDIFGFLLESGRLRLELDLPTFVIPVLVDTGGEREVVLRLEGLVNPEFEGLLWVEESLVDQGIGGGNGGGWASSEEAGVDGLTLTKGTKDKGV